MVLLESNRMEAGEFLVGRGVTSFIFCEISFVLVYLFSLWKLGQCAGISLVARFYEKAGLKRFYRFVLFTGLLYLQVTAFYTLSPSIQRQIEVAIHKSYPFGLPVRFVRFWATQQKSLSLEKLSKDFKFHAYSNHREKQIYVLVIGESSRYDNWSLGGYERDTNPRLEKTEGLSFFSNMLSSGLMSSLTLPIILTRAKVNDPLPAYQERSIVSAFKEAGFKTYWLSNQAVNLITSYTREADVRMFTERAPAGLDVKRYDDIIFEMAKKILNEGEDSRALIILHTVGSHYHYSSRYPKEFDRFQPSMKESRKGKFHFFKAGIRRTHSDEERPRCINAYDNSILYTDYLVSDLISFLKQKDQVSAVMYFSDHGENLGEAERGYFGHGVVPPGQLPSLHEIHVPFLIWVSDKYKIKFPLKTEALSMNKEKKLSSENIFYSTLDLADIHYDKEDLSRSVANPEMIEYPRSVLVSPDTAVSMDNPNARL